MLAVGFAVVIAACGPLATFMAPRETEVLVTHPGPPEIPATATTPTIPATPTYTTVEHGGGGGEMIQAVGGFVPGWGAILVAIGGLASSAANIYLGVKSSRGDTAHKVVTAMIQGVEAAGEAAATVKKAIQSEARAAGPDVSAALEHRVAALTAVEKAGGVASAVLAAKEGGAS